MSPNLLSANCSYYHKSPQTPKSYPHAGQTIADRGSIIFISQFLFPFFRVPRYPFFFFLLLRSRGRGPSSHRMAIILLLLLLFDYPLCV